MIKFEVIMLVVCGAMVGTSFSWAGVIMFVALIAWSVLSHHHYHGKEKS